MQGRLPTHLVHIVAVLLQAEAHNMQGMLPTHLAHVVVALLQAETCKTQRRLPTPAVLLWKVHAKLVQHLARVSTHSAKQ